jgi:putative ABC transport system permease protein
VANTIDKQIAGDYVIQEKGFGFTGFSTKLAEAVEATPGVATVMQLRFAEAQVHGAVRQIEGVDAAAVESVVDLGTTQGRIAEVSGDKMAVSRKYADAHQLTLGSTVPVTFAKDTVTLTVAAVYEKTELAGSIVVGLDAFERYTAMTNDNVILVDLTSGTTPASVRPALEQIVSAYPTAEVQDRTEFKESQAAMVNQLLALIYVLLALAIVIALFGIANTLSLSIHERRRELGLLRAVGQFRSQTRSAVRWESAIIAVFGTLLGLGVGVAFGSAIVKALAKEGITNLSLPATGLLVITLLGATAGIAASVRPAWRAAKLNVLAAIAAE